MRPCASSTKRSNADTPTVGRRDIVTARRDFQGRPREQSVLEIGRRLDLGRGQAERGDDRLIAINHLGAPATGGQVALEPREIGPLQDPESVETCLTLGVLGVIGRGLAVFS